MWVFAGPPECADLQIRIADPHFPRKPNPNPKSSDLRIRIFLYKNADLQDLQIRVFLHFVFGYTRFCVSIFS